MASNSKSTDFSATESALGYLYQIRLALLFSVRRCMEENIDFSVFFETLDDVVFEPSGNPKELLQFKHHNERAANLTDASPDLWKTLRVWMEGRANKSIPEDGLLFLVTTSNVGKNSAASMLLYANRDVSKAVKRLSDVISTSESQKNKEAYELFRKLSDDERNALLEAVIVVPQAPSIVDVDRQLQAEARLAVKNKVVESFLSRLEGWWFRRVIQQMTELPTTPIVSEELQAKWYDLGEQFTSGALPVDQDIFEADIDAEVYQNNIFVQQAELAGIGNRRILAAIRDYYRAFAQRSRWVRESLLPLDELNTYERLLKEEWELEFDRVTDELGEDAADEAKQKAAKVIYAWVEKSFFPIREGVQHPSITRGSFHILADRLQVGWHPEFLERLKHLLESEEAA